MNDVVIIAESTALRILRLRSVYFLLVLAVILMASGHLYGDLTAGLDQPYSLDLGLAVIRIIGVLGALVACFDLPRELREKTLLTILSKPLGRDRYLTGKFLGLGSVQLFTMALATLGLLFLTLNTGSFRPSIEIMKMASLEFFAAILLLAITVLFSTMLTEWTAVIASLAVYWLGHIAGSYQYGTGLLKCLYRVLPNFSALDMKFMVNQGVAIDVSYMGITALLTGLYITGLLVLAGMVFRARDVS